MWTFDASSALLPVAVLASINASPTHGYGIRKHLSETGFGEFKGGTIYPLLRRMEEAELITAQWDIPERGATKKIYRITKEGSLVLQTELEKIELLFGTIKNF